ncbi:hypothetical protein [Adhaeribacter radiodurans]|uniref:hypothetical protein n=1 Tax=Adhaeribacter radiodurans TaxID=2745197 RepID=UPI0015F7E466|nr:hypothetical protein [Adhaeribacter radiodurans]
MGTVLMITSLLTSKALMLELPARQKLPMVCPEIHLVDCFFDILRAKTSNKISTDKNLVKDYLTILSRYYYNQMQGIIYLPLFLYLSVLLVKLVLKENRKYLFRVLVTRGWHLGITKSK